MFTRAGTGFFLSHINPGHTLQPDFPKIIFNIVLPSIPRSSYLFVSFSLSELSCAFYHHHACGLPAHFFPCSFDQLSNTHISSQRWQIIPLMSNLFVFYLTTLSRAQMFQHRMIWRLLNCWGFGRRWWRPNLRYYPAFACRDGEKPRNP